MSRVWSSLWLLVLPATAGLAYAQARRQGPDHRPPTAVALGGLCLLPIAAADVAVWDVVLLAACAAGGVLLAGVSPRRLGGALTQLGLCAVLAEAGGRWALPPISMDGDPGWEPFGPFDVRPSEAVCALAFPGTRPQDPWYRAGEGQVHGPAAWRGVPSPQVLHVGDSMLAFGPPLPPFETNNPFAPDRFVALLDAQDPHHIHRNLGIPGTGPDAQAALARAVVGDGHVRQVVLYYFAENDLSDLDRAYPCCPAHTFTTPSGQAQCDDVAPAWLRTTGLVARALRSPPPYLLTWLTHRSIVVAHLRARAPLGPSLRLPPSGSDGQRDPEWQRAALSRLETILTSLHADLTARGVALTVVALPVAPARQRQDQEATLVQAVQDLCARRGIPFANAWTALDPVTPDLTLSDGYHLSAEGHRRMAAFLRDALGSLPPAPHDPAAPRVPTTVDSLPAAPREAP